MPRAIGGTTQRITTSGTANTSATTLLNTPTAGKFKDLSGNSDVHDTGEQDHPFRGPRKYLVSVMGATPIIVKFGQSGTTIASSSDGQAIHPNSPRILSAPVGTTHVAHMSSATSIDFQIEQLSAYSDDV